MVRKRNQAQAALHFYEERSRQDLRNLINIVRKWAERKEDHALDWLTALWDIACKSRRWDQRENRRLNTGSIAFYAFPQYLVDMIVERTGGRPVLHGDCVPHLGQPDLLHSRDQIADLADAEAHRGFGIG